MISIPLTSQIIYNSQELFSIKDFLLRCLKETDAVACVSETTLSRLKVWTPRVADRKVIVIHNCVDIKIADPGKNDLPEIGKAQLFLTIAQHKRNKNIILALSMLCELLAKSAIASQALLLVVSNDRPETAGIKRFIENNRLQNNVKHINGMSDKQYQRYELVIAPPTMEGFGLPMAETLWCGCRVVCSDISAFREFGGNSCYYFDLERPSPELTMAMATRRALDNTRRNTNFVNDFSIGNASDNMSLSMVGY